MKSKYIPINYYLFAHIGDVLKNQIHLVETGTDLTLCGKQNSAINQAKIQHSKEASCENCLDVIYSRNQNLHFMSKNILIEKLKDIDNEINKLPEDTQYRYDLEQNREKIYLTIKKCETWVKSKK